MESAVLLSDLEPANSFADDEAEYERQRAELREKLAEQEERFAKEKAQREAEPRAPSIPDQINSLQVRVERLERLAAWRSFDLICFLSYPFHEPALRYGATLRRLLELLGVEVITAESYAPTRVEDKVKAALAEPLHFVVVIFTDGASTDWLRDELARSQGQKVAPIVLVEDGATFVPGIYGNLEYIPFAKDHIGDASVKLAEGLSWIRQQLADAANDSENGRESVEP